MHVEIGNKNSILDCHKLNIVSKNYLFLTLAKNSLISILLKQKNPRFTGQTNL